MFNITKKDLGTIKSGKKISIEFPYKDIMEITKMESPCDCSVPYNIKDQSLVRVDYTPKAVPSHLIAEGKKSYTVSKTITITYKTGTAIKHKNLVFTATVID